MNHLLSSSSFWWRIIFISASCVIIFSRAAIQEKKEDEGEAGRNKRVARTVVKRAQNAQASEAGVCYGSGMYMDHFR